MAEWWEKLSDEEMVLLREIDEKLLSALYHLRQVIGDDRFLRYLGQIEMIKDYKRRRLAGARR